MDKERLLLWIRAVLIFTPSSKRIWEVSANYDDIVEFMTALDDHMVSGLNDKELQRIGKYSLKDAEIIKKRCEELGINIYCYESEAILTDLNGSQIHMLFCILMVTLTF